MLRDYKLEPPDDYSEIGKCIGCGDPILAGEKYIVFESGRRIHDHEDCAYQYCRKEGSAA
jgi:hypothetical protein